MTSTTGASEANMSHHIHDGVAQVNQGNLVTDPVCGMDVDPNGAAYR